MKAKNKIQNQKNQNLMKDIRQKTQNELKGLIYKKGDKDDSVDTGIDMETNVMKNTELSTSDSVARQLIENPDDMVDTEEEMDFDDLTITGNYSDYDILEEEKEAITENYNVWFKTKKKIRREIVLLITYS